MHTFCVACPMPCIKQDGRCTPTRLVYTYIVPSPSGFGRKGFASLCRPHVGWGADFQHLHVVSPDPKELCSSQEMHTHRGRRNCSSPFLPLHPRTAVCCCSACPCSFSAQHQQEHQHESDHQPPSFLSSTAAHSGTLSLPHRGTADGACARSDPPRCVAPAVRLAPPLRMPVSFSQVSHTSSMKPTYMQMTYRSTMLQPGR